MEETGQRHGRWLKALKRGVQLGGLLALSACVASPAAPAIPIFGSYFPAWLICTALGIVTTIAARLVLVWTGIDEHLPLPLLVYVCLVLAASIGYWFVAFGEVPH